MSSRRRAQVVWLLQLRLDPQPGTAVRGEGRGRQSGYTH